VLTYIFMGRRWLGFSESDFERAPHNNDGPPPSLWWSRLPAPKRQQVLATYIRNCARGGVKLPARFKNDLAQWLQDLTNVQSLKEYGKARATRYWDLPTYARAHGMVPHTFMKRFRELEKIAIKLFPDRVPHSRQPRAPLTEEEIQEIQKRCLDGDNIKDLAKEFRVTSSKVGHLCREQKAIRNAARQKAESETAPTTPPPDEMPF
jgi:hypothetical protein